MLKWLFRKQQPPGDDVSANLQSEKLWGDFETETNQAINLLLQASSLRPPDPFMQGSDNVFKEQHSRAKRMIDEAVRNLTLADAALTSLETYWPKKRKGLRTLRQYIAENKAAAAIAKKIVTITDLDEEANPQGVKILIRQLKDCAGRADRLLNSGLTEVGRDLHLTSDSPYVEATDDSYQRQPHEESWMDEQSLGRMTRTLDLAVSALLGENNELALSLACLVLESVPYVDTTQGAEDIRVRARDVISQIPNIQTRSIQWSKEAISALSDMFAGVEQMSNIKIPLLSEFRAWEKVQQQVENQKQLAERVINGAKCVSTRCEYLRAIWPQQQQALITIQEGALDYIKGITAIISLYNLRGKSREPLDATMTDKLVGYFTSYTESGRQRIEEGISLLRTLATEP